MLKIIGHKIKLFNEYCSHQLKLDTLKQAGLDVQIEIIFFFTSAVCFFRNVDLIGISIRKAFIFKCQLS